GRLDILKSAGVIFPQAGVNGEELSNEKPQRILRLGDVLDSKVPVIPADAPMHDVVETLITPPCPRRIIVVDSEEQRHVVGIIADRDVVLRAHAQSRPGLLRMLRERMLFQRLSPQQQAESTGAPLVMQGRAARDIMSLNVITAPAAMPLGEAVRLLVQREIKLLPVVDQAGALLGAVSRTNALQVLVSNYSQVGVPSA
ncbi:MAG: CBS domain-containing protein, partial [Chloroflexi bacterium]|nr:CBS domain-containing protein [Chloroflexota bacterium]